MTNPLEVAVDQAYESGYSNRNNGNKRIGNGNNENDFYKGFGNNNRNNVYRQNEDSNCGVINAVTQITTALVIIAEAEISWTRKRKIPRQQF